MKNVLRIIVFLIVIVSVETSSQNYIKDFDGIPITAGLPFKWAYPNNSIHIDSMKEAGINVVGVDTVDHNIMNILSNWQSDSFHVIPAVAISQSLDTLNWIVYYTDAKYSVWETEDTAEDTSYIQHDPNIMCATSDGENDYIKLRSESANYVGGLIWGPYYNQHVYELNNKGNLDTAIYTADFRMKLELNPGYLDTIHPDTPLCVIKVTQSYLDHSWVLGCKYPIRSLILTRGDFEQLNVFDNYSLVEYNLTCDSCTIGLSQSPKQYGHIGIGERIDTSEINKFLMMRDYIEFQVVWLGKPNYLLSIDKVTVHDQKGIELMDPTSDAKDRIERQAGAYNNNVAGWIGIDEPNTIDKYAPIKRVVQILKEKNNNKNPLWLALMGKWDGVFENRNNPFGVMHLSPWKEMKKRIGSMNVWQDAYYLDYPYRYNYGGSSDTTCNCDDYRVENIKIAAE